MLVKHLIQELQQCNPDLPVHTEGCDCWGDTYSVIQRKAKDGDFVLIARSDGEETNPKNLEYDNSTCPQIAKAPQPKG